MSEWRGAAAICVNEKRELLMIRQGRPDEEKRWSVPSGGADEGESDEACCAREVWEETGYRIEVGAFLHAKSGVIHGIAYTVRYFEAQVVGGQPTIQDPDGLIYDIQWKTAEDIAELDLTYPEDRRFLLDYLRVDDGRIVCRSNPLTIRRLTQRDESLLMKWMNDPEVLRYYGGRDRALTIEMVRESYYPQDDALYRCIVEYEEQPIGYLQYYPLDEEGIKEYELEDTRGGETIYGMDQYIGEPNFWNRGIGQRLLNAMLRYLEERHHANRVVIDPQAWNERAIACYEKCGFRRVKLLPQHEWHEGAMRDCWLMEWRP